MNTSKTLTSDEISSITRQTNYGTWRFQKTWKPLHVADAEGCWFTDGAGKRYLDFSSQLMCVNLGHKNPRVIEAIARQARELAYAAPGHATEPRARLSLKLREVLPEGLSKFFFATSGTEANEAAFKIARMFTGRTKIISRYRSYHGSTSGSIAATGDPRRWAMEPAGKGHGFIFAPETNCYDCPIKHTYPGCNIACADYLEHMIRNESDVAAVIVEPVVGTNGVLVPPPEYFPRLREICDRHGVLLIADEVMSGWGRTGKWFAVDHWGVKPDILVTAKGITSAYVPLGLCATTTKIADYFEDHYFSHGHTYEAHPLTLGPAVTTIEEMQRLDLVARAAALEPYVRKKLQAIQEKHPAVGEVRGLGLFFGVELVKNRATKEPFNTMRDKVEGKPLVVDQIAAKMAAQGVAIQAWISHFVIAPPLIVTEQELDIGLAALDEHLGIADALVEAGDLPLSYTNDDLAVVPENQRTWGTWNFAALWISMSMCVPTYMYASSLIAGGMNWWQAILTVFIGNSVVLVPMILNGHAGARYGIPFPIFARSSFGIRGANIPALLRAIVGCGWFGIQTWIGGHSLYQLVHVWFPSVEDIPRVFPAWFGLETGPAITFFAFWLVNMFIVHLGIESIRKLLLFKAVFLPVAAVCLLAWAIVAAKGLGPILAQPSKFQTTGEFWNFFFPALTAMVGFWATLSLNIPDFTRYAKSQRAQIVGQVIGLPPSMSACAFVGVVVTSATAIVYGKEIWDPVVLAGKFHSPVIVTAVLLTVVIATLATNIAANIVSPANDFSHLWPARIDFKLGGYITGVIGILIFPWKLLSDPRGYIFTWLVGYSSLLGPIGGILIADYFLLRRQRLYVQELYSSAGRYWYNQGFNPAALIALLCGILPNVPGFLTTIEVLPADVVPPFINGLYHYAWFVGFAVSGAVYWLLAKLRMFPISAS